MIYLDYSATTPVSFDVLESYNRATREYIGNVNSIHSLGNKSRNLYNDATNQIASLLNIKENEVIYTSGATEANNMALIGVALANKKNGNHIIVSKLEHPSIYEICSYLEGLGFKISYVDNTPDGLIDVNDLKKKMSKDTILVSICAVNSEIGVRQPLKTIKQIIKKENQNTFLHSDMTQAIGKTTVNMLDVDLASLSAHKFFGPKGIGMLYKNEKVNIVPLIHGTGKTNNLRPGTPMLPLVVALSKALRIALNDLNKKELYIKKMSDRVIDEISKFNKDILINHNNYCIPQIVNISLMNNIKPESFIHAMDKHEIYLSTNTACSSGNLSTSVMALYNDTKRATSTIRISISSITTNEEIDTFLECFKDEYNKLKQLINKE